MVDNLLPHHFLLLLEQPKHRLAIPPDEIRHLIAPAGQKGKTHRYS